MSGISPASAPPAAPEDIELQRTAREKAISALIKSALSYPIGGGVASTAGGGGAPPVKVITTDDSIVATSVGRHLVVAKRELCKREWNLAAQQLEAIVLAEYDVASNTIKVVVSRDRARALDSDAKSDDEGSRGGSCGSRKRPITEVAGPIASRDDSKWPQSGNASDPPPMQRSSSARSSYAMTKLRMAAKCAQSAASSEVEYATQFAAGGAKDASAEVSAIVRDVIAVAARCGPCKLGFSVCTAESASDIARDVSRLCWETNPTCVVVVSGLTKLVPEMLSGKCPGEPLLDWSIPASLRKSGTSAYSSSSSQCAQQQGPMPKFRVGNIAFDVASKKLVIPLY
jgi:hypothetical protein